MTKIATCIAQGGTRQNVLEFTADLCQSMGLDLNATRIGRSYTPTRGWFPCIFITQELQAVAEEIERRCLAVKVTVWHLQGSPTKGYVHQYCTPLKSAVFPYSDKPSGLNQIIEFNGSKVYVG